MLRARKSRREEALDAEVPDKFPVSAHEIDPEHEALPADSVGVALLVVLGTLTPAERIAFVLHDTFDLSFDEIAPIVGRSATAARQLAMTVRETIHCYWNATDTSSHAPMNPMAIIPSKTAASCKCLIICCATPVALMALSGRPIFVNL